MLLASVLLRLQLVLEGLLVLLNLSKGLLHLFKLGVVLAQPLCNPVHFCAQNLLLLHLLGLERCDLSLPLARVFQLLLILGNLLLDSLDFHLDRLL